MENLISYYDSDKENILIEKQYVDGEEIRKCLGNPKLHYELQEMIKEDFIRIKYIISDNHIDNDEKEILLKRMTLIIDSICENRFYKLDKFWCFKIMVSKNYIAFNYYIMDYGYPISKNPYVAILNRNLKEIYFIDEKYSVSDDEELDNYDNVGHQDITYFDLNDTEIKKYGAQMEEKTSSINTYPFDNPEYFCHSLKSICMKNEDTLAPNSYDKSAAQLYYINSKRIIKER